MYSTTIKPTFVRKSCLSSVRDGDPEEVWQYQHCSSHHDVKLKEKVKGQFLNELSKVITSPERCNTMYQKAFLEAYVREGNYITYFYIVVQSGTCQQTKQKWTLEAQLLDGSVSN